jgi:hypothetical protein
MSYNSLWTQTTESREQRLQRVCKKRKHVLLRCGEEKHKEAPSRAATMVDSDEASAVEENRVTTE